MEGPSETAMEDKEWERVWCYYRNLVHSMYREVRHIGEPGDYEAKCQIKGQYLAAAKKIRKNRYKLKSTVPLRKIAELQTDKVISCYEVLTGLVPEDLAEIFRNMDWKLSYGGEKWAKIAELIIRLKREIDFKNLENALGICEEVREIRHNSGPLVPSLQEWEKNSWLKEKWPILCDRK
jgi:hypothetical protein